MKILFYLPVVTPWWFENIITPMVLALGKDPDVSQIHIVVASLWRNTGVAPYHLRPLDGVDKIRVHMVDTVSNKNATRDFRLDGADVPGLMDLVTTINPDITLARSADVVTPRRFPGRLRFITEGAAPPYKTDARWVVLDEHPFRHGLLKDQVHASSAVCYELVGLLPVEKQPPESARKRLSLPTGRPILAAPLHYEHEENFFLRHAAYPTALAEIRTLLQNTDPNVILAITDHPLNRIHVDRRELRKALAKYPKRIVVCDQDNATPLLSACADAMVSDLSKAWSLAAFNGTPIINIGREPMAEWIHATPGAAGIKHIAQGNGLPIADPEALKLWYGWHLGARLFDPGRITLPALLRRFDDQPAVEDFQNNLRALRFMAGVPA